MHIFVCHHKDYPFYHSDALLPIHVGKRNAQTALSMAGDDTGDNISVKNPYFSELTAAYWIWKNVKENIVGLCHYRRYFNFKNDHTRVNKIKEGFAEWSGNNADTILPLFSEYDLILPNKKGAKRSPESLYDFYAREHHQKDMDVTLDVIREKYPEHYQTAYQVLHTATTGYYANMLVAKKDVFDAYAEWLFDILFEVERRIQADVETRDTYQQRVYGFLSERLMTVYVALHPELKIKELPVIFVEEDKKKWRKYLFRYWKRKVLRFWEKERK